MTRIIAIEKANDGSSWGYDSDSENWVPIDEAMQKGSFAGNLVRSAGRGFRSLGQGVEELAFPDNPAVQAAGEDLRARQEAAATAAPWAEMLGGAAPEMAAGIGAGLLTGGAGFLPQIAAQGLAGGSVGLLRSADSAAERAANAALGAAFGLVGEAGGQLAVKGMMAGSKMAQAVIDRGTGRLAQQVQGIQQQTAARQAAEAAGAGVQQPGSVGAATTPRGLTGEIGAETRAMEATEAAGGQIKNPGLDAEREAAMSHGYRDPWWAGSRTGSESRVKAALQQLNPEQDAMNQVVQNENSALKAKLTGQALGLGDMEARDVITDADLLLAENRIAQGFERVADELPNIGNSEYRAALDKVEVPKGAVGATRAESFLADMKANLSKNETAFVTPQAFMRDVQVLTGEMADAYKNGRVTDGEMLGQAVNYLYDLGERATKNAPSHFGRHGRDETIVSREWAEVRKQHQMFRMITAPGVRSPTGEINSQALYRQMTKARKSGGWGIEGPPAGSEMRPLFEVIRYDRGAGQTHVPMTGVRTAMMLAKNPMIGGALGAGGVVGASQAIGSLWD